MYNHYGVTTLDDLIKKINMEKTHPDYDSSYLDRLEKALISIRSKYENIRVVPATLPMKKFEDIKWDERNIEIAKYFEDMVRLITKSKRYYLISGVIEDSDANHILIVGKPDGLNFEGKMGDKANIYEVKSFDLNGFYTMSESKNDEDLIKKVLNRIKIISSQLIVYQYLLKRTIEHGLIGRVENINLHGKIYFHFRGDRECLYDAEEIIRQNIRKIISGAVKYNAYNFILKKGKPIYINDEEVYYFEISFRTKYNQKAIEIYFNDLNKLLRSLKLVDNGSL
jgi:uncharacterized protein YqkB/uncharacterized ubiquitin-like protein YukD